ncbi:hypothetical protein TRIUR3_12664 [Triticum urartu]|uniref:Uncharacterized protein n=1 Tax=Triticum urartu TaxID=4572 RepID=M7Z100_TRIUA|nr:hypothetical protein TRIUR3_12664 [Triticum urartu]
MACRVLGLARLARAVPFLRATGPAQLARPVWPAIQQVLCSPRFPYFYRVWRVGDSLRNRETERGGNRGVDLAAGTPPTLVRLADHRRPVRRYLAWGEVKAVLLINHRIMCTISFCYAFTVDAHWLDHASVYELIELMPVSVERSTVQVLLFLDLVRIYASILVN